MLIGITNTQKYFLWLLHKEEVAHLRIFGKNITSSLYNIVINVTVNVYADVVIVSWTGCGFAGCKSITLNKFCVSSHGDLVKKKLVNHLTFTEKPTNSIFPYIRRIN